jgi:hypothetical protein
VAPYNQYCISQTNAISANTNYLPTAKAAISGEFNHSFIGNREASILAVDLRSASTFTVKLNAETIITAISQDGEYVVRYDGSIDQIVFSAETTLTYMWVGWVTERKNTSVLTFNVTPTSGTSIQLVGSNGYALYQSGVGEFTLDSGFYTYTITNADYATVTETIFVENDTTVTVSLAAAQYTITFANTPENATVVVKNASNVAVQPVSANVYSLADSSVVGNYSYTISAPGYVDTTGTIDAQQNATITKSLAASTYTVIFNVTPKTATFNLKNSDQTPITPASITPEGTFTFAGLTDSRVAGSYSYTASAEYYENATGSIDAQADQTITTSLTPITLTSITIATPPTKVAYTVGETFDPTGAVVTALLSDSETQVDVTESATWTPTEPLATTDTEAVASYTYNGTTKTADVTITVAEA